MDRLVHEFDTQLETFSRMIQSITEQAEARKASIEYGINSARYGDQQTLLEELEDLQSDWADLVEADVRLRDELKEDQWLVVFRQ